MMTMIPKPWPTAVFRSAMVFTADCAKNKSPNLTMSFSCYVTKQTRFRPARLSNLMVAIMYLCDTLSTKKITLSCSIGDSPVCLLVFALLVLLVRPLPPAILPSDLGTIIRESPVLRALEGRPRCIGRDFDGIFQAAWLAPPWTSQAACGSSQTFFHPFFYVRRTLCRCPIALHTNASSERPYENNPHGDRHQRAFCSIFNSSIALAVVFLLECLRFVPNPEPDFSGSNNSKK